jgi:hypothetical protein
VFPDAEIVHSPTVPHSKAGAPSGAGRERVAAGKRTLVIGEHRSAVRFSDEAGNTCPNYWHFSLTGFCFYDCLYCYLAGVPGVWHSPTIRAYVNLEETIADIDRIATACGRPTAFYAGKLQDGLSLDPLTRYSAALMPFFAEHPFARQVILTKSADVSDLLRLKHGGNTTLSWSLNPPVVIDAVERNTPSFDARLAAMKACAEAGFPVRAVVMPLVPLDDWPGRYAAMLMRLLKTVPIQRLTLGGVCSYDNARRLMEQVLGAGNIISRHMAPGERLADGRKRYGRDLRVEMYSRLVNVARGVRPNLEMALCLEEPAVWGAVGLAESVGRCNCVV